MDKNQPYIHETADVHPNAQIGDGSMIWNDAQVREGVVIGEDSIISKGVYIDKDVPVGSKVKIQNYVSVFHGVEIEDGVFVGPHAVFTNDLNPRAITPEGEPAGEDDWEETRTLVEYGASIGANASIRAGVTIGRWALVGMGAVVVKDVEPYTAVVGNPAKPIGKVDKSGNVIERFES